MSRRRLNPDEHSLWQDVTRSIAPLPKRRIAEADDGAPPPAKLKTEPKTEPKTKPKALSKAASVPAPAVPMPVRQEPAPLGRKARRRLARGSAAIDGRLDLHGLTQARAHGALLGYLRGAQASGAKVVLVITGKGDPSGERGVLKRQVPQWLRLPEFRELVVGFESAGIGHGGEGAMYVRIRRARD